MNETIFMGVHSLMGFQFPMCLLPWLLKRAHWALSVILPIGVFLILAQLNPSNFDFMQRLWRGFAIGVLSVTLGFAYYYLLKRTPKNSKS